MSLLGAWASDNVFDCKALPYPRKSVPDPLTNHDPVRQIDLYDEIPFILTVLGPMARDQYMILMALMPHNYHSSRIIQSPTCVEF